MKRSETQTHVIVLRTARVTKARKTELANTCCITNPKIYDEFVFIIGEKHQQLLAIATPVPVNCIVGALLFLKKSNAIHLLMIDTLGRVCLVQAQLPFTMFAKASGSLGVLHAHTISHEVIRWQTRQPASVFVSSNSSRAHGLRRVAPMRTVSCLQLCQPPWRAVMDRSSLQPANSRIDGSDSCHRHGSTNGSWMAQVSSVKSSASEQTLGVAPNDEKRVRLKLHHVTVT